jgi:hypothetical protein
MHTLRPSLAFEPLTGALTVFAFQYVRKTRPALVIPLSRVIFRRYSDIFLDAAMSEFSDSFVDVVNALQFTEAATMMSTFMVVFVLLVLWRRLAPA